MNLNIEKLLMNVPITKINNIKDNEVYTLLEKFNMCGSIKIKPIYWILKNAIQSGKLTKDKTVLEASSGNTAISLAYLSNLFDLKVLLVVPKNTANCKKKLIKSYGVKLIEVDGATDEAIDYRNKLYNKDPNKYFLTDQFNNIDNMNAHYHLTGKYIYKKLGDKKIDFFVAGLGTAGTLLGTAKYLKEKFPDIKIIGINPLDKVEGIKNYNTIRNIGQFYKDYKYLIDEIIDVSYEKDAITGINEYLEEGYFNGISSGAILSGTKKYLEGKKGLRGVIIAPDGGDYYFGELIGKIR